MKIRTTIGLTFALVLMSTSASAWWWLPKPEAAPDDYTNTQYPIVLVHGLGGYGTIGEVMNSFHTIPFNLERSGAKVLVPPVSSFSSSEARGQQLADYLSRLDGSKYNLIGYSQGAPTARVAASIAPEKVASVTSVNGVNTGSEVADLVESLLSEGNGRNVVARIVNSAGKALSYLNQSGNPQDAIASLKTVTTAGSERLNDALGWAGVSRNCSSMSEDVSVGGQTIKMFSWGGNEAFTSWRDPADYLLSITSRAVPGDDDGLISTCSQKFGNVISVEYDLNHLDAVNQSFGVRGSSDPVALYRTHANRLKNKGL